MPKIKTKDLPIKVWIDNSGVAVQYYDPHSKRYTEYIRKDIAEGMVFTEQEENLKLKKVLSNLWKPADGDDLPEINREVIALVEEFGHYKSVFAHRPPEYWDGKNILTGEVTRYYPKRYDKGNWNQPNIKWWLDCDIPKTKMEEEV